MITKNRFNNLTKKQGIRGHVQFLNGHWKCFLKVHCSTEGLAQALVEGMKRNLKWSSPEDALLSSAAENSDLLINSLIQIPETSQEHNKTTGPRVSSTPSHRHPQTGAQEDAEVLNDDTERNSEIILDLKTPST